MSGMMIVSRLTAPDSDSDSGDRQLIDALRESEECFRSAFEHAAIGMAVVGLDGRWLQVNRSLCEIVGYSEQELLATDFQSITHPQDLNLDLEYVRRLIAGEIRTYQMTKRYFHREGRVVWVLLSVSLVRNQEQQPLYFISQIQDISERRAADEAMLRSEAKFRQLVDQAADGMFVHDRRGKIIDVNVKGCQSLRYTREEMIALNVQDIEVGHASEVLTKAWRSLRPGESITCVGRHRRKDGSTFPVEARLGLFETGGSEFVLALVRDISDRVRAEAVERDRRDVLERIAKGCSINEAVARLAGMVEQHMAGSIATFLMLQEGAINLVGPSLPDGLRAAILARPLTVSTELCDNAPPERRPTHHDFRTPTGSPGFRSAALECGLLGCWAFLIESSDESPLGVFAVFTPQPTQLLDWERGLCDTVTNLAALALERHQMSDNLARRAFYDALTGSCNRAMFNQKLLDAVDNASLPGGGGALLLLDLDHFKDVNDNLGHDAGDELLQQFAARVRGALREEDTLARLGGDEFAVHLPGVRTRDEAAIVANKIISAMQPPFQLRCGTLSMSVSMGGCLYPADGRQAEVLLKTADSALYRVKRKDRNGFDVGRD
jgi:diguanylate cyclase (GGDEF)-like protein/PAS domain S-box-containing protein